MENNEIKKESKNEEEIKTNDNKNQERIEIPEKLTIEQAIMVLVNAARLAQSKGIFSLDDAEVINKAIKTLVHPVGPVATNA